MSGSTGNEPLLVFRWLYETLTNDAILAPLIGTRVYEYSAPLGATYPFITMAHMGGSDKRALGGIRVWNEGLYLITGHIQGQSLQDLKTIADRIDTLIDNTQNTTLSYATIVYCL